MAGAFPARKSKDGHEAKLPSFEPRQEREKPGLSISPSMCLFFLYFPALLRPILEDRDAEVALYRHRRY
jgi:hypothetical protein